MVLAASLDEKVEILSAPENSKPGDLIHFGDKPVFSLVLENLFKLIKLNFSREILLM
jgi:hypothetical protein